MTGDRVDSQAHFALVSGPMAGSVVPIEPFGTRMARYFRIGPTPTLTTRSFATGQLSVTWLSGEASCRGASKPLESEEGFLCELTLKGSQRRDIWSRKQVVSQREFDTDCVSILDLRRDIEICATGPIDSLLFHFPLSVLDEFADAVGAARIDHLDCVPGVSDSVLAHLGAALLHALRSPDEAGELFFDHLAAALNSHVMQRYGGLRCLRHIPLGGLAPSKERRAKELLASKMSGAISVAEIADACGLSRAYFIRAFRTSTGTTPYDWLQGYRVNKAKDLLMSTRDSIADVALACGFADQSHLTRTFTHRVGAAPATWRRACIR